MSTTYLKTRKTPTGCLTSRKEERMTTPVEHVDALRDHWWWRPGWRVGRHFYACHFTMNEHPRLTRLVTQYQAPLKTFQGLDLIPDQWLHLTMQGIGFVDDLDENDVARLAQELRESLASLSPPVVTFQRPVVRPEAVYLAAEPAESVATIRAAVRATIAAVLGDDRVELASEHVQGYRPHVSIAYSNAEQPAERIVETLRSVDTEPVEVSLREVGLLEFHRDRRMYEWTSANPLRIGR
jgi:2'-5' RNA ligase